MTLRASDAKGPDVRLVARHWSGVGDRGVVDLRRRGVLLAAGIYAFLEVVGFRTRVLTGKSTKTAESMYDSYADSPGKQKRYARRRGGEWRDEEPGGSPVPPS